MAYLGFHFGGGGGVENLFVKVGVFALQRHAFARGFGGMVPRENLKKWCNVVRFGEYFAKIL